MKKLIRTLGLSLAFLPLAAHADTLTLSLTNPTQSAAPGDIVSYTATLYAPTTNTGTIYLNGDSYTVTGPAVVDDSNGFLGQNFPLFLTPGQTYTGLLFQLDVPSGASIAYSGIFDVLGGSTDSSQNFLARQSFATTPSMTAAQTPEPSSWLLLGTGALAFLMALHSRRRSLAAAA